MTTKISRKMAIGNATLIEKEVFLKGEYQDTFCYAQFADGYKIGGYTSIQDALAHRCEWDADYVEPVRKPGKTIDCRGKNIRSMKDLFAVMDKQF